MRLRAILLTGLMILSAVAVMPAQAQLTESDPIEDMELRTPTEFSASGNTAGATGVDTDTKRVFVSNEYVGLEVLLGPEACSPDAPDVCGPGNAGDYDLVVSVGSPPDGSLDECSSAAFGSLEFCSVTVSGDWVYIQATNFVAAGGVTGIANPILPNGLLTEDTRLYMHQGPTGAGNVDRFGLGAMPVMDTRPPGSTGLGLVVEPAVSGTSEHNPIYDAASWQVANPLRMDGAKLTLEWYALIDPVAVLAGTAGMGMPWEINLWVDGALYSTERTDGGGVPIPFAPAKFSHTLDTSGLTGTHTFQVQIRHTAAATGLSAASVLLFDNAAFPSGMVFDAPDLSVHQIVRGVTKDVAPFTSQIEFDAFRADTNKRDEAIILEEVAFEIDLDDDGTPEFSSAAGDSLPLTVDLTMPEVGVKNVTFLAQDIKGNSALKVLQLVGLEAPEDGADAEEEPAPAGPSDADADNIADEFDNCPSESNPHQSDADRDGLGDACDEDADGDNVRDDIDNCIGISNDQSDIDGDDLGDACDDDIDGDGISNSLDLCPTVFDDGADMDGDGIGDACESDRDGDGIDDSIDRCPDVRALNNEDLDGDGLGDVCDNDIDGDGSSNDVDNCPRHDNRDQADLDGDRLGDACDADINGDGIVDNFAAAGVPGGAAPAEMEALLSVDDKESPGFGLVALIAAIGAVLALRRR